MNIINYKNLADSIDFYSERGYQNIEVPWYVTSDIMEITRPSFVSPDDDYYLPKNNKVLVASAEQSFIYLMVKGLLPEGFYQGVTPCYRFEKINALHRKCFMKNELIYVTYDMTKDISPILSKVIGDAQTFFETVIKDKAMIVDSPQENSTVNLDLMYKDQELGSYGIRNYKNLFQWVYGTGCAEPRLSILKKL